MRIKQFPGFGFNGITKIQQYFYLVIDYDYNTVIPLNTEIAIVCVPSTLHIYLYHSSYYDIGIAYC